MINVPACVAQGDVESCLGTATIVSQPIAKQALTAYVDLLGGITLMCSSPEKNIFSKDPPEVRETDYANQYELVITCGKGKRYRVTIR